MHLPCIHETDWFIINLSLYKTTNTGTTDKTTSQFRAKKIFIGAFQETQGKLAVQLCGGQKEAFPLPNLKALEPRCVTPFDGYSCTQALQRG